MEYYAFMLFLSIDCPRKTYKPRPGDGPCFKCTQNVKNGLLPRKSLCECLNGYFRPIALVTSNQAECEGRKRFKFSLFKCSSIGKCCDIHVQYPIPVADTYPIIGVGGGGKTSTITTTLKQTIHLKSMIQ